MVTLVIQLQRWQMLKITLCRHYSYLISYQFAKHSILHLQMIKGYYQKDLKSLNFKSECKINFSCHSFIISIIFFHQGAADSETCGPSSNFDRRISQLRQNVNHAIWRYELVSGCSSVENSVELSLKVRSSSFEEPSETSSIDLEATQFNGKPDHLLSQMLSSPDSLAHLCLQKGSLVQAQQVIKVFQLEGR